MSEQTTIDRLQSLLLICRLPTADRVLVELAVAPDLDKSIAACCMFAGMRLNVPIPCLAAHFFYWFFIAGKGDPQ